MKKVFYVFRTPRETIFQSVKTKTEPDHLLYGANHLQKLGYEVNFRDTAYSKLNLLRWAFLPLQELIIKATSIGFKFDQAILLLPQLSKSDVVISTVDSAGLPLLLFKKIGILKQPLIYISTGLINEMEVRHSNWLVKFYVFLFSAANIIICHSRVEAKTFKKFLPNSTVKFVPFGIDVEYFKCTRKSGKFIFSVGRDRSRDYNLLSKVAKQLPDEKFIVVTSRPNIKDIQFPPNVKLYFDIPYLQVKKLYCQAKLVFLPIREINRASGQMAFLESVASKNKVVIANTLGISQVYPEILTNDKNVGLYKTQNANSAVKAIDKMLKLKTVDYNIDAKFGSKNYAQNLKEIINNLIND